MSEIDGWFTGYPEVRGFYWKWNGEIIDVLHYCPRMGPMDHGQLMHDVDAGRTIWWKRIIPPKPPTKKDNPDDCL